MIIFQNTTHIPISIASFLGISGYVFLHGNIIQILSSIVLGSIIPDIDHKKSLVGRYNIFSKFMKHRGFTHTIPGMMLFTLPTLYTHKIYGKWFMFGYMCHLISDTLTPNGIMWLYPFTKKRLSLNLIKCGGSEEGLIIVFTLGYIFFS